jgi:hypothetical protein
VIAAIALLLAGAARATAAAPPPGCFPAAVAAAGPGLADPFRLPLPAATQLNADGKVLYRQGKWDDARAKYRAAEAADPDFLAPALNVACSFVRQERFAEATAEVLRLIDRAYLPWSAEALAAADLGALKVRPEMARLRAAFDEARGRWAEGLPDQLVVVARMRAPLKLGDTPEGVLVLGPRQELFAWSPRTLRYRQLTMEEGRVLALARSADGRRVAYATAEKLVRGPGGALALRGVKLVELDLTTLSEVGRAMVDGDVRKLEVFGSGDSGFVHRLLRGPGRALTFAVRDGRLDLQPSPGRARPLVTLTGRGTEPVPVLPLPRACGGRARERRGPAGAAATVAVTAAPGDRAPVIAVGGPFGAGLGGLPIP